MAGTLNVLFFRQGEAGDRTLRLLEDGRPADLADTTSVRVLIENVGRDGLYVDTTASVTDSSAGLITFRLTGNEFDLPSGGETELQCRAVVWVTFTDGSIVPYPRAEGGTAIISRSLPASGG